MSDVKSLHPARTITENLELARHAANLGDTPHTILHAQEAVCLSMATLAGEIAALRTALKGG